MNVIETINAVKKTRVYESRSEAEKKHAKDVHGKLWSDRQSSCIAMRERAVTVVLSRYAVTQRVVIVVVSFGRKKWVYVSRSHRHYHRRRLVDT